jgi:lipopolysaccharide heptosyltransferase III
MLPARPPERILCIKLKHIGDVLLMTPAIRLLHRAWPGSRLAALVPRGTEAVLEGNPDLDEVLVLDRVQGWRGNWRTIRALRRYAPDLVLEMGQGDREAVLGWLSGARERVGYAPRWSGRWRQVLLSRMIPWDGQAHVIDSNVDLLRACGISGEAGRPVLVVQAAARARMAAHLDAAGLRPDQPLVVVHPVSRWLFKAWPETGCVGVIRHLVGQAGVAVAVTSSHEVKEVEAARRILARAAAPVIDLVGRTSLTELAAVLERAALFIGVDSAPMHMATALGVPVVALFGPSGEHNWGPRGDGHVVLTSPFLCRPCGKDGCLGSKRSDCLEAITSDVVVQAAERLLAPGRPRGEGETGEADRACASRSR